MNRITCPETKYLPYGNVHGLPPGAMRPYVAFDGVVVKSRHSDRHAVLTAAQIEWHIDNPGHTAWDLTPLTEAYVRARSNHEWLARSGRVPVLCVDEDDLVDSLNALAERREAELAKSPLERARQRLDDLLNAP